MTFQIPVGGEQVHMLGSCLSMIFVFHKLKTLFHFSPAGKKRAYLPLHVLRKQGYHVTKFARKTNVSSYKCWR